MKSFSTDTGNSGWEYGSLELTSQAWFKRNNGWVLKNKFIKQIEKCERCIVGNLGRCIICERK